MIRKIILCLLASHYIISFCKTIEEYSIKDILLNNEFGFYYAEKYGCYIDSISSSLPDSSKFAIKQESRRGLDEYSFDAMPSSYPPLFYPKAPILNIDSVYYNSLIDKISIMNDTIYCINKSLIEIIGGHEECYLWENTYTDSVLTLKSDLRQFSIAPLKRPSKFFEYLYTWNIDKMRETFEHKQALDGTWEQISRIIFRNGKLMQIDSFIIRCPDY